MTYQVIEIDGMKIHYSKSNIGTYKIHLVKCLVTGKFLKHSLAMKKLINQSTDYVETVIVLFSCILANIFALLYCVYG